MMVIDIIDLHPSPDEAQSISDALENLGFQIRQYPIIDALDFRNYLEGTSRQIGFTDYIIICGTGNADGFVLPLSNSKENSLDKTRVIFTAVQVETCGVLHKECIFTTASINPTEQMEEAFLEANASRYIGPFDEANRARSVDFIEQFFLLLSSSRYSVEEALEVAEGKV